MTKHTKTKKLLAVLVVFCLMLGSFPVVYNARSESSIPAENVTDQLSGSRNGVTVGGGDGELAKNEEELPADPEEEKQEELEKEAEDPENPEVKPEEPEVQPEEPLEEPEEEQKEDPAEEEEKKEEPEPEPEPEEEKEEEPEATPKPKKTPKPTKEPKATKKPKKTPKPTEEPEPEPEPEEEAVEEEEDEEEDDFWDDEEGDEFEFDDDEFGSVASELLAPFDQLASEQSGAEDLEEERFTGSATIVMVEDQVYFGGQVTLKAKVEDANMEYRVVWEAKDDEREGWFEVGTGTKYVFTLTEDIVDRSYRVVLRPKN